MAEKGTKGPHIVISDQEPGLPYSKGLMASTVMVTGLSPYRAYHVAEEIEDRLREQGRSSLTTEELAEMKELNPKSKDEFEQDEAERRFLAGGEPQPAGHRH